MHDISQRIADVLLEVEAVLRTDGLWETNRPAQRALHSAQPFCMDTLCFEQWLQWIFLPRMKSILQDSRPLPGQSRIHPWAVDNLPGDRASTANLLTQIRRFDELIAIHSAAGRH